MKPRANFTLSTRSLIVTLVISSAFFALTATAQDSWSEIPLPVTNTNLSVISFTDTNLGLICGYGREFLFTTDGGESWRVDSIPFPDIGSSEFLSKCVLVSDNVIWAGIVVNYPDPNPDRLVILRSSDRGQTWILKSPSDSVILGVDFLSENIVHFITPTHSWTTTDGGDSWQQQGQLARAEPPPVWFNRFHSFEFFDDSVGYLGGSYPGMGGGGTLVPQMTTDGGSTWSPAFVGGSVGSTDYLSSSPLRFSGRNGCTFGYGWYDESVGQPYGGMVLSWNRLQDTVLIGPRMQFFNYDYVTGSALNRQNIWLLRALEKRIQRTTNGGSTWVVDTLPVPVSDFLLDNDGHRFALGNGRLFRWNGVILGIEPSQEQPTSYELKQNYPNPFNPTTNIEYQIPNREFVSLRVFDILGREVKTLVNEQQSSGTHHVEFDASNLSSGVYLYRLKAGEFIQQQKMLLIK